MADRATPIAAAQTTTRWATLRPRLRRWRRYWLDDPLFGAFYFAMHYGGRLLPTDWCSALGGFLGAVNWRFRYRSFRDRAGRLYLRFSGGQATAAEVDRATRQLFVHLGRVALEFSILDRLWPAGRITPVGGEHLVAAHEAGKPIIVMGVHVGNWEAIAPTMIALLPGVKGAGFYQPRRSRFEHWLVVAARRRYGGTMFRPGIAGARLARRLLDERGVLLVYADEERRGYVVAPLFGRSVPAHANLLDIVRLAWASGAAVIPAYVERLDGARFRTTFLPPVELVPRGEQSNTALLENVHRLDRVITPIVVANLEHWYMLVEPWAAAPPGGFHRSGQPAAAAESRG